MAPLGSREQGSAMSEVCIFVGQSLEWGPLDMQILTWDWGIGYHLEWSAQNLVLMAQKPWVGRRSAYLFLF